MPGKNPAEAIEAYLEPLRQSISCFTRDVLRPPKYIPDTLLVATLRAFEVITTRGEVLHVSFTQHFHVEKRIVIGWKVVTRAYMYSLDNERHREILAFHWHPEISAENPTEFPHLHISEAAGASIRDDIRDIHFRTDRVAFEQLGLMLINDFQVEPERPDAVEVLNRNLKKFVDHRSWHSK